MMDEPQWNYHENMDKRMFDFEDFYYDIASKLPDPCVIAEVGVANGASAIFLAETLLNLGKKFHFVMIDNMAYGQGHQHREIIKHVCQAGIGEWIDIVPASSVEASCMFPDNHFDFVYIDASHKFEWTKADIKCWHAKVKHLGILAGHDYNSEEGAEVKEAVLLTIPRKRLQVVDTPGGCNVWMMRRDHNQPLCC